MKFVIVGAGLAGSLTARVLQQAGHECVVIDNDDVYSASKASSNLYIASWLKRFANQGAQRGLRVLEKLALPTDRVFEGGLSDAMNINHIAQRDVLVRPNIIGEVTSLERHLGVHYTRYDGMAGYESGIPVICTGHRGAQLVPGWADRIDVKVGHAFFFEGQLPKGKACIQIVSPYKHGKLYQFDENTIYYADSVALKLDSYWKRQDELKEKTLDRFAKVMGTGWEPKEFRVGYRPLIKGADFGLCEQVQDGVWAINGGGKNGMVAYCNAAAQLLEEVQCLTVKS